MSDVVIDENLIIHRSELDEAIYSACQELGIEDLKSEGQRPWKAVLMLVGERLFKDTKILKQSNNIYNNTGLLNNNPSNCNAYDYDKLLKLCDDYILLSSKYNKLVSTMAFSFMCCIPTTTIDLWKDADPSDSRFKIWKKLQANREDCLKDKGYDSNNVVGTISIGNTEFGWSMPGVRDSQKSTQTAAALPTFEQPKLFENGTQFIETQAK